MPTYGDRRRVPGLRREELALLAGVSASYYTRLEQGQSLSASPEVLDALARALRLDDSERRYLHDLARVGQASCPDPASHRPSGSRRRPGNCWTRWGTLPRSCWAGVPTYWRGTTWVMRCSPGTWIRVSRTVPAERPNMARLVFLDPHIRELYADWPGKARAVVGSLRLAAGQHPEDAALHALVGELSAKSGEFASMWADHRIKACTVAAYEMHHPLVGALTVMQQTLSHGPGPVVVVGHHGAGLALAGRADAARPAHGNHQGLGQTGADTAPRRRGLTHLAHDGPADNGLPWALEILARTLLTRQMRHRLAAACQKTQPHTLRRPIPCRKHARSP